MPTTSNQGKYRELEQIQADLSKQAEKLRAQMKDVEGRLAAVTVAIQVWKDNGAKSAGVSDPRVKELRGMTQVQALLKIARDSGNNRFRIAEVKPLLMEAGVVNSKKNANTILYTTILRSGKFMRVGPGEYEVMPAKSFPASAVTIKQIA